ncbi:hypothetical protein [Pandoravirus japonicus]|uniref:Uncharacterized protein n=1 Tax=Pandoravirus japonicus TaxID=2823154 RepID=A0A811BS28_9VIRU|nr:hypothetical protein [Pandoravirus japonicus]
MPKSQAARSKPAAGRRPKEIRRRIGVQTRGTDDKARAKHARGRPGWVIVTNGIVLGSCPFLLALAPLFPLIAWEWFWPAG